MKTKIKYLLVLVLASFVFAGCCTMHSKTTAWEYKTVKLTGGRPELSEDQLNELGKDGWKLLNPDPTGSYLIFERPKQ